MTLPIDSLHLRATQWGFLSRPDAYVAASNETDRRLVLKSTRRQFRTAKDLLERLSGSYGDAARRGILLADDVGLGKTTVAALVAWVIASADPPRRVRILAPNDVMARRWKEELLAHVELLQKCAPALRVRGANVKPLRRSSLKPGAIQVVKHSYASSKENLSCDLLIIDEAHRAKGEGTGFGEALKRRKKLAKRVLILTATPFSIHLAELGRMLTLIGGEEAHIPVKRYSKALDDLYTGTTSRVDTDVADKLAGKAGDAVEALSQFVIRHGIEDLPLEQSEFGICEEWSIEVPEADADELELMLRMDRALRVGNRALHTFGRATNDPRFHVGWQYFDEKLAQLEQEMSRMSEPSHSVVRGHTTRMRLLRRKVPVHAKMKAVAKAVTTIVKQGEKVLLFCHHIATAQELTVHLAKEVPRTRLGRVPPLRFWREAWGAAVPAQDGLHAERNAFIDWLCSDLVRGQVAAWLSSSGRAASTAASLRKNLETARCRQRRSGLKIAAAARELFQSLASSNSSRRVLNAASLGGTPLIPGAHGRSPVLGVCAPGTCDASFFLHDKEPDTVIAIFNSPFGPDVLVVTDKLSEGVDLHRYCRHLVHYELDASPIRTVQRNGRLRRVGSWAAVTGRPILYSYPAFGGTRDYKLVQIIKKRINSFSLLLGGVPDFDADEVRDVDERWRSDVIDLAKGQLQKSGRRLCAR